MSKDLSKMSDNELLSIFLFGEITEENLYGDKDDDIDDLIFMVDEDIYNFSDGEEVVGIDLAYLGDSDNHSREFREISNGVLIEYDTFGNSISGMEFQGAIITYLGTEEDRLSDIIKKLKSLSIDFNEKDTDSIDEAVDSLREIVNAWDDYDM